MAWLVVDVFLVALIAVFAIGAYLFTRHPGDPYADIPAGNGTQPPEPYTATHGRRVPPRPPRNPNFARNRNGRRVAETTGALDHRR